MAYDRTLERAETLERTCTRLEAENDMQKQKLEFLNQVTHLFSLVTAVHPFIRTHPSFMRLTWVAPECSFGTPKGRTFLWTRVCRPKTGGYWPTVVGESPTAGAYQPNYVVEPPTTGWRNSNADVGTASRFQKRRRKEGSALGTTSKILGKCRNDAALSKERHYVALCSNRITFPANQRRSAAVWASFLSSVVSTSH